MAATGNVEWTQLRGGVNSGTITLVIDGGTSSPTTGVKAVVEVPYDCSINSWTMLADQSGSAQVTISKSSYAGFPGSLASIVASAPPALSSAQKNKDSALTGWTKTITAGDILSFNLDSVTTCLRIVLELKVTRT